MGALSEALGGFPPGFDDGGVITGAGEIHGVLEGLAGSGVIAEELGFHPADVGRDGIKFAAHVRVLGDVGFPTSSHGFNGLFGLVSEWPGHVVDELLRRGLVKVEVLEDGRGRVEEGFV